MPSTPPAERWRSSSGIRNHSDKVSRGLVAAKQWGRIHWLQLRESGVGKATVSRWVADGYLTRVRPCVYAVGHLAPLMRRTSLQLSSTRGQARRSATKRLRGGGRRPTVIEVSTPRRCESPHGLRIHSRRSFQRV